ncbi:MBL fold metallo-hydrolase [Romeria aff. gracilis LEGE 07310]|uniref:MBL fold metallo-hydrolase n=1 Tax=Vasconcelosia minhoensis LEGE 07310 TaxID=915328 RepID=A0A8J7A9C4_9CYAN|nr:MBL fold metallo-hydrolase [Romeria gracilis]MBE9079652.1 MBL fold metallo-hydrolase [Romeria aff. gracilis LEGE 07310]
MTFSSQPLSPPVQRIDFEGTQPASGSLDVSWIHGSVSPKHNDDPDIQVHAYNEHTYILRQNMAVHYEAPFMFLLFGNERAILLDTGATRSQDYFPLRQTVDALIERWLSRHPRADYRLVVAHTHLHRDHFEGNSQFLDRPHTTMVGRSLEDTIAFYGFSQWPTERVSFDLGGRQLQIMGSPGHEDVEVSIYDPYTQILFTGDIFYPGRLYIRDWDAFASSIARLIEFTEAHPITHILGCHVEMSIYPRIDYLIRTSYQPHERPPQMTVAQLRDLGSAIAAVNGRPGIYPFDAFILYNGVPDRYFSYEAMNPEVEPGTVGYLD